MSSALAIRSFGAPYFALIQQSLAFMDTANAPGGSTSSGSFNVYLEFALRSLPTKLSSDDEIHPLFSYHEAEPSQRDLLYFGVTPSGRVGGWNVTGGGGNPILSGAGLLSPNGRVTRLLYNIAGTQHSIREWSWVGDVPTSGAVIAGPGATTGGTIAPAAGVTGELMLFNGRAGLTRCACEISYAQFTIAHGYSIRWPFDEGAADIVRAENIAVPPGSFDAGLTAQFVNPALHGLAPPWGGVPDDLPSSEYQWALQTEWTKRDLPETVWQRGAA